MATSLCLNADVFINEFLASNSASILDEDQDYSDFIELHNNGEASVSLSGFYLTDDANELTKWQLPAVDIDAGGYLLIYASGKDKSDPSGPLHTNFKLSRGGEYLGLVATDGVTVLDDFSPEFPEQFEDVSYGTWAGDEETVNFLHPSPGAGNAYLYEIVSPPVFSVEHGFYEESFTLEINSASPGTTIYYSLDGSIPKTNILTGDRYDPATGILIEDTAVVRAIGIVSGFPPSEVSTASYIFLDTVVTQGNDQTDRGFPDSWGGTMDNPNVDYEMDPDIPIEPGDLATIPTVSIVLPQTSLWSDSTGIYVNPNRESNDLSWERACSVEYIDPDSNETFTANGGVRTFGGAASNPDLTEKIGFRVVFRGEYGLGRLESNMFDRVGPGDNDLNTIVLRSHWGKSFLRNDALTNWAGDVEPWECLYMRDVFTNETYRATGNLNVRSMMVHLYLNGLYFGLYEAMERPDDAFLSENLGGDDEDYDVMKGNTPDKNINGTLQSGDRTTYTKLFSFFSTNPNGTNKNITNPPPISPEDYKVIKQYLDVPAFADYMISLWYVNRTDFPNKNWWGGSKRGAPGEPPEIPWIFFTWDSEATLWFDDSFNRLISFDERAVVDRWSTTSHDFCQIRILRHLRTNEDFRKLWSDRSFNLLFNNGPLSTENNLKRWDDLAAELDPAIHGELARWGDWVPHYRNSPVTKEDWVKEVGLVREFILKDRNELVLSQMREFGIYPEMDPPAPESLSVWPGEGLILKKGTETAIIKYSFDDSDPRDSGTEYIEAIDLAEPVVLKAALVEGEAWSAVGEYMVSPLGGLPLAITEIMYHPGETVGVDPGDGADLEFLEITNVGKDSVSLANVVLTNGVEFDFSEGTISELAAGESVIVVRDLELFEQVYGNGLPVAGEYDGVLDNGGEKLELSVFDYPIHKFEYDDGLNWNKEADGAGYSLELRGSELDASDGFSWLASSSRRGTPGTWTASVGTSDPFAPNTEQYGVNWRHHDVFGTYYVTGTDSIYHRYHGWQTVVGGEISSWWYDYQLGWIYTNAQYYPFFYSYNNQNWLLYLDGTQEPRWFYDYAIAEWSTDL